MKILFLISLFFALCYCANEVTADAEEIVSRVIFSRDLGSDEAEIDLSYYASPLGNFTVEEIEAGGVKIDGLPKKAEQMMGCSGAIFRIDASFRQKIAFDKNNTDLALKTKWSGKTKQDLIETFKLSPSFAIASVSNELSATMPLQIKMKDEISAKDWDYCGLDLPENSSFVKLFSSTNTSAQLFQDFSVKLEQIKAILPTMPTILKLKISCHSSSKDGKFSYKLSSEEFSVKVE